MFKKKTTAAPTKAQRSTRKGYNNHIYNNTSLYAYQHGIDEFNRTYEADEWFTEILVRLHLAEYAEARFDEM